MINDQKLNSIAYRLASGIMADAIEQYGPVPAEFERHPAAWSWIYDAAAEIADSFDMVEGDEWCLAVCQNCDTHQGEAELAESAPIADRVLTFEEIFRAIAIYELVARIEGQCRYFAGQAKGKDAA